MRTLFTLGIITVTIQLHAQVPDNDVVDINNIEALLNSDGGLFMEAEDFDAYFYVPKPTGEFPLSTIFSAGLWIGASDSSGNIYTAAHIYRQFGQDFWFGPIATDYEGPDYLEKYNKVWVCDKPTIEYHIANFEMPGYEVPLSLALWPGNGNIDNGEAAILAPFYDYNNNLIYDPENGDYPIIRGDKAAYFIFNDDAHLHTETDGAKLKLELHGMAYAFDTPSDSALNNTLFINYSIINRSEINYSQFQVGVFSDFNIGAFDDDYLGCDSTLNMFFGYNMDRIDGPTAPNYGSHPPAQGIMFLNQPMYMFKNYYNDFTVTGNPETDEDFVNYLAGNWKDGTPQTFGDNGYGGLINSRYMFPADIYDTLGWSAVTAVGAPSDARGIGAISPQTLYSNDTLCLDVAFPFAIAYDDLFIDSLGLGSRAWYAVAKLKERANLVIDYYDNNISDCQILYAKNPDFVANVEEEMLLGYSIFPNPVSSAITIDFDDKTIGECHIAIYSAAGVLMQTSIVDGSRSIILDLHKFPEGMYLIQIKSNNKILVNHVVNKF
ncbi:MAG TPA: T9SS type A sorting domain-containing protein [Chitinophagales bacterium]|nr:T9SS type A sorting domain-containing protein [Chitinophagales bacterium]